MLKKLEEISLEVINLECGARDDYFSNHRVHMEDRISRSLGIIKYARKIDFSESMNFLSDIRLGIILSLIREIDLVVVKGKTESCRIYEVFEGDPEEIKELKLRTRDIIHTGIHKYKDRKFKDALTYFKEAKSVYPKDIIPLLYVKRCVEYIKNPPPPNWAGVFKVHA